MGDYLLVNDIHAADRPPSSCTEVYTEDLHSLLGQVLQVAERLRAEAIVLAGDVFHHKAPSRTSHKLVMRLIRWVQEAPCPVYIVPGNHDLQHDRLDSLSVTQPLGVLLESGARLLNGWYEAPMTEDDPPLYGVPWLQGYGPYLSEAGRDDLTEMIDCMVGQALTWYRDAETRFGGAHVLAVAHAPLYPPGQELPYEHFPAERWAEAMGGQGQCWYGHVHERHGIWEAGGVTFANFGALSRGSLHEYNKTRQVAIGCWDSITGTFTEIPLDARPMEEIYRLREQGEPTDLPGRLDKFLAGVSAVQFEIITAESVIAQVREMGLGKEAEELVEELLS